MDQLSALKAFCGVVEAGGFSAAAAVANLSHTALSKQVRQLESVLGAQLLNRTTRRLALTEAGKAYYERARRILDDLQEAYLAVTRHHAAPRGTLRINAPMAFGLLDMMNWLPRFKQRYPELKVDLVCNDRFVDLIDEGFDVALRLAGEMPDSTLMAKKLAIASRLLVASPGYLKQRGTPSTPEALAGHECLTYTLLAKPDEWQFQMPDGSYRTVTVRGSFQANTGIAMAAAATAGLGITATTSFIVRRELAPGTLVPVLADYPLRSRELYAIYPHNRHLSPKVRAFIDFATDIYRQPDW